MTVPAGASQPPPQRTAWTQNNSKFPSRKPYVDYKVNANSVPQAERYKEHRVGRIPCVVASEEELAARRQARKCLLCNGTDHYLRACPEKEKKFREGKFFYCPTQYGQKIE
jgi:hypothetical protein